MASTCPQSSRFAIDILTVPVSSCECERLFSELGDLLEPKRCAISGELLAALQLICSWTRAEYTHNAKRGDDNSGDGAIYDDELARKHSIQNWVGDNWSDA
jgi:hypothetical protein